MNQGPLDLQSNALPLSYTPTETHCLASIGLVGNQHLSTNIRISLQQQLHCWCSGIMQDSHSCDSGSIPGQCKVFYLLMDFFLFKITKSEMFENEWRGHPGLNWGHLDLQSNALPLSYTPLGSPLPAYLNQIHLSFPHFHIRNFII